MHQIHSGEEGDKKHEGHTLLTVSDTVIAIFKVHKSAAQFLKESIGREGRTLTVTLGRESLEIGGHGES